ncbi:hypothetical protein JM654_19350 [Microbacterium oxydans]|nr:hypothetical protein [Microbacterium oxydans]
MIPFGPQLIGQTEKALNALLLTLLSPHALSEREWVTLRLVSQFEGEGSVDRFVADRLHDPDSALFLRALQERGTRRGFSPQPHGHDTGGRDQPRDRARRRPHLGRGRSRRRARRRTSTEPHPGEDPAAPTRLGSLTRRRRRSGSRT